MRAIRAVVLDLLREAASRKWFLAMGLAITLFLALLGLALRMDVVDGALAATHFFGASVRSDIVAPDLAVRPALRAASYLIFYGGLAFGLLACADFGPSLLSPGRIEQLLSLPVRRWELLLGTFLGVLLLSSLGALYGAGGISLILAVKVGVFTLRPLAAALLTSVAFAAIYAPMLVASLFVRSAALSAAVGGALYLMGIVAGNRLQLETLFERGAAHAVFMATTALMPPISLLGKVAGDIAGSQPIDVPELTRLVLGVILFAAASLAVGAWRFEHKDF